MSDDFEDENEQDIHNQAEEFESLIEKNETRFYDVEQLVGLATHYIRNAEYAWAEKAIDLGLNLHPISSELKLCKVEILYKWGRMYDALSILKEVELLEPTNAEVWLFKGEIYSELDKHNESIDAFENALELCESEDKPYVLVDLATEYHIVGNQEKARKYLMESLKLNPRNDIAYIDLLFTYQIDAMLDGAAEFFKEMTDIDPYNEKAWYYLGIVYQELELVEKGIECFDFATAIKDDYIEAYFQKAFAYKEIAYYHNCIQTLQEAMNHDAENPRIYYEIGEAYEDLEEYEKAIEYYRIALNKHEDFADAWIGIGLCMMETNKGKEGLVYIKKGLQIDPENFHYKLIYADALGDMKLFADAESIYEGLVDEYNSINELWLDYSELFYKMEDYDTALSYAQLGLKHLPDDNRIKVRLSGYLYLAGFVKEAYKQLDDCLAADKDLSKEFLEFFAELEKDSNIVSIIDKYLK